MIYFFSIKLFHFHFMGLQWKMMGNDGQHCSAHHFHDFFHENDGQHRHRRCDQGEEVADEGRRRAINCTKLGAKPSYPGHTKPRPMGDGVELENVQDKGWVLTLSV
jgi:hypothetical protein